MEIFFILKKRRKIYTRTGTYTRIAMNFLRASEVEKREEAVYRYCI